MNVRNSRMWFAILLSILTLTILSACSGSQSATGPQSKPTTGANRQPTPEATELPPATAVPPATSTPAAKGSAVAPGFNIAVPASDDTAGSTGLHPSLVFDATDDPMVAFMVQDPNGDGDLTDSTVSFTRWDRANGIWTKPVVVDTVDDIFGYSPVLQLARDASNNLLGVAYHRAENEIALALSSDNGASWKKENLTKPDDNDVNNPALAMANGKIHIAFMVGDELRYLTRTGATGEFKTSIAPVLPNASSAYRTQPQVAVDSTGKPALAYVLSPADGYNTQVAFWRPSESRAVKVADSNNVQNDAAYISLAFAGDKPRIAVNLSRGEKAGGPMYFMASDDGKTWSAPVQIPQDGDESMEGFLALAANPQGVAITAPSTGGSEENVKCGQPKLARSTDLKNFKTCSPDADRSKGLNAGYVTAAFDSKGKLYLAFQNVQAGGTVKSGLIVWREP